MIKQTKKVLITLLTLLFTAMTVMNAYALSGDPNAWKYKLSQSGSKTTINATKTGFKSAIKVIAPTAKVALKLGRMANTAVFALAVADIIGDGVQWLYDEGTKTVKYKKRTSEKCKYDDIVGTLEYVGETVCHAVYKQPGKVFYRNDGIYIRATCKDGYGGSALITCSDEEVEKELTLEEIAEATKRLADKDNADAKKLLQQIVQELAEQKAYDDELERAKVADTEADPEAKDLTKDETKTKEKDKEKEQENEKTKDKPFELPAFCEWSGICESTHKTAEKTTEINDKLNDVKESTKEISENSKSIKETITEFFDFFKNDEIKKDGDDDKDDKNMGIDWRSIATQQHFKFNKSCPADPVFSFSLPGSSGHSISFPLHIICQGLAMLYPAVQIIAYIKAIRIIGDGL